MWSHTCELPTASIALLALIPTLTQIDVGVCLLGPTNGQVCSGHGSANLDSVTCSCDAGFSGQFCQSGSAAPPATNSVAVGFGVTAGVLGAAVLGVWTYARFFGGGPRVAAAGAAVKAAGATLYRGLTSSSSSGRSSLIGKGSSYTSGGTYGQIGAPSSGSGGFNAYGS